MNKPPQADVRCEHYEKARESAGNDTEQMAEAARRIEAIDAERAGRIALAYIEGNGEAADVLIDSLPECRSCYGGVIRALAVRLGGEMTGYGDADPEDGRLRAQHWIDQAVGRQG